MKRPAFRCLNDRGLDETVSVILMVILVIAVSAIVASIVFGLAIFYPKSAYIAVQTEAKNVSPDNWYLSVSHMNGDAAYLNHTLATNNGMPVDFQFTTPSGATVIPFPDPADGPETWKPGDTLFVYNKSGLLGVTKNETTARKGTGLPVGVWRFDVVDKTDDVLIYTKNTGVGVAEPTPTTTISPAPTFTGITPASGPISGGTPVTITGTNLFGATSVTFGGTSATSVTVVSGTSITATTPPHALGTVNVVITTLNGTATGTGVFTYIAAPVVTSVSPTSGSITGGTPVIITGTGFTGATAVSFGGTAATSFTVNSATQITATAPAHVAGTIDITVTTPSGTSATSSADIYTFTTTPTLTSISPNSGPTAGGQAVTISGTGFTGTTALTFGGTNAISFSVVSDTTITAITPAHAIGMVNVVVTTLGGTASTTYTYVSPLTISGSKSGGQGLGDVYADSLMASPLGNSWAVNVIYGNSQTFYLKPNSNKQVYWYQIDTDAKVYPAAGDGVIVNATVINVVTDRTFNVEFK
ncbi:MAG: IPT/TIG domain-containing protein [Methanomicrobiales archaeon]